MSNELFHCAAIPLGPGSLILPGNWGRLKRRFETDALQISREAILEDYRRRHWPDKPSRLKAAFACLTLEIARNYHAKHAPATLLYKVELLDPTAPIHYGDYEVCMAGFQGIDGMQAVAKRYWQGESMNSPEIVTLSPLRVIERVRSKRDLLDVSDL